MVLTIICLRFANWKSCTFRRQVYYSKANQWFIYVESTLVNRFFFWNIIDIWRICEKNAGFHDNIVWGSQSQFSYGDAILWITIFNVMGSLTDLKTQIWFYTFINNTALVLLGWDLIYVNHELQLSLYESKTFHKSLRISVIVSWSFGLHSPLIMTSDCNNQFDQFFQQLSYEWRYFDSYVSVFLAHTEAKTFFTICLMSLGAMSHDCVKSLLIEFHNLLWLDPCYYPSHPILCSLYQTDKLRSRSQSGT